MEAARHGTSIALQTVVTKIDLRKPEDGMSKLSSTMNTIGKVAIVGTISFMASNVMAQATNVNWMAYMKETKAKIAQAEEDLRTRNPQSTVYQQAQRDLPVLQNTLAWQSREADKKARSRGYVPDPSVKKSGYDHKAELYRLGVREGVPSPYSSVPPYPPGTKPVERSLWDTSSKGYEEYGRHVINNSSVGPNSGVESFRPIERSPTPPEAYGRATGYTKLLGQMRTEITSFPDELIHHILPGEFKAKDGSSKVLVTGNEKMLYIQEQLFNLYQRLEAAKGEEAKKAVVASFEKTSGISETRLTASFAARDAMFERNGARQAYLESLRPTAEESEIQKKKMAKMSFLEARQYEDKMRIALNEKVGQRFPELSAADFLKAVTTKTGQAKSGALNAWIERAGLTKITKASGSMGILGLAIAATASSAANAGEAQSENEDSAPATFSRSEFRPSAARRTSR